jgi:hypothetical protein
MSQVVILPAGSQDDAPEGVSLEQYAAIGAHLAIRTSQPRAEVLGLYDLDEPRWNTVQQIWSKRIEDEVMRGSAPGLRVGSDDRYPLSMHYAVAYAEAAQRLRNGENETVMTAVPTRAASSLPDPTADHEDAVLPERVP